MDDYTANLVPLYEDDSLLFPTIHPYLEPTICHQDLEIQGASSLAACQQNSEEINTAGKRQRKPSSAIRADNHDSGVNHDDRKQKRAIHRDIERRRRQEMATLCAALRNLLPLEYIKGKRSISDHVLEAVNYIKHMEKNIRELEEKRNKLRYLMGELSNMELKNVKETNSSSIKFTVKPCLGGGIEILMENYSANNWFPLSRILDVLLDEGHTVVTCICTKVNANFLYRILTEASCMTDVDLICLQKTLTEKVMAWKNFKCENNTRTGTRFA